MYFKVTCKCENKLIKHTMQHQTKTCCCCFLDFVMFLRFTICCHVFGFVLALFFC